MARLGKTLHRPVFELAGGLLTLERRENCETVKVWLCGHVEIDFKKKLPMYSAATSYKGFDKSAVQLLFFFVVIVVSCLIL